MSSQGQPGGSMTQHTATSARRCLIGVALVIAFLAAGCGSGDQTATGPTGDDRAKNLDAFNLTVNPSGPPKRGGILKFALDAESDGYLPTKNRWASSGTEVGLA